MCKYCELGVTIVDNDGDAVKIMREAARGFAGGTGHAMSNAKMLLGINSESGCDSVVFRILADMVERDYVSREVYEDLREEFTWETTFLHRMGKKCGTKDVPSLVAYVDKLEARVEELEAIDRRIAETDSRWEAAIRDLERMKAERDEWKAKAEGFAKALEELGCSVLANGTVFPPCEGASETRACSSMTSDRDMDVTEPYEPSSMKKLREMSHLFDSMHIRNDGEQIVLTMNSHTPDDGEIVGESLRRLLDDIANAYGRDYLPRPFYDAACRVAGDYRTERDAWYGKARKYHDDLHELKRELSRPMRPGNLGGSPGKHAGPASAPAAARSGQDAAEEEPGSGDESAGRNAS